MATEIHEDRVEIYLDDDTAVTIRPLPIKLLRKFMKAWNEGLEKKTDENGEPILLDDDGILDVYVQCNGIALSKQLHASGKVNVVDQYDNPREFSGMTDLYKDYLEDNVDVPNSEKILEICGGIKDDPKLMEAAMEALAAAEAGTN